MEDAKTIDEKLFYVQQTLKVPKNQHSDFGGYDFRNLDDILEAAKPVLGEVGAIVLFVDDAMLVGDRNYIKSTAIFRAGGETIETTGFAWEPPKDEKKKFDRSQITGSASSYARKYAANALFALDDVKDADETKDFEDTKVEFDDDAW